MRFFQILLHRHRAMKITSVATLSQVMWQLKKSQEKSRQSGNFRDKICYSCSHPRALATRQNVKEMALPARAKYRSCSRRGWQWYGTRTRERPLSLSLSIPLLSSVSHVTFANLVNGHFDFLTIFLVVTGKVLVTFDAVPQRWENVWQQRHIWIRTELF